MKIYMVRHGQSEGNLRQLWYGSTDLPLTELGREHARQAGEKLKEAVFSVCYASPLCRARETAEIALAGRDIPLVLEPDLREQHMGRLEPLTFDQIAREEPELMARLQKNWVHDTPPEGESFDAGLAPGWPGCWTGWWKRGRTVSWWPTTARCAMPSPIC